MELRNEFEVSVPLERAWEVFTDLEAIVPCLPGARLTGVDGDAYRGAIKVKVGSVSATYKGTIRFLEQDLDARRLVLSAEGKDARGQGTAKATIAAQLEPSAKGTAMVMITEMAVTGIVAQFGRGIMADVSRKLIGQFAQCIEQRMASPDGPSVAEAAGASASRVAPGPSDRSAQESADGPPLELAGVAAGAMARRGAYAAGVVSAGLVALWLLKRALS
jgi:carbon monoxide dehydrogenase subunit G